jgi:tetratricopeptide (TPR) repeat protein
LQRPKRLPKRYLEVIETNKQIGAVDHVAINNVASTYARLGQYQRALNTHLQLLELRQGSSDTARAGRSITLSNIGNCYYNLGNLTKAIEYYGQSLQLMRQIGNNYYTAVVLNHLGVAHRSLGEFEKAADCSVCRFAGSGWHTSSRCRS